MPFIFRGCQGWFQHLKERRIKNICISLPLCLPAHSALSFSPPRSLLTSPPVGLCVGEGMPERDVSGCSRHPLGWGDGSGQRQGCDGGARRTRRARGVGGEPGSARVAVLGCAGCRLWGSPGSLQKGAWAPKFAPVPRTPPAPPGVCRGSLECWGCKGSQDTPGEHPPCPDREPRTANREWHGQGHSLAGPGEGWRLMGYQVHAG